MDVLYFQLSLQPHPLYSVQYAVSMLGLGPVTQPRWNESWLGPPFSSDLSLTINTWDATLSCKFSPGIENRGVRLAIPDGKYFITTFSSQVHEDVISFQLAYWIHSFTYVWTPSLLCPDHVNNHILLNIFNPITITSPVRFKHRHPFY